MATSEEANDPSVIKFNSFVEATDLPSVVSNFTTLCREVQLDPDQYENFYPTLKLKLQQWKCKALWQLLDSRSSLQEYRSQTACKGKRVLIVGAGPVGLRTAIECALLGSKVDVVEKRTSFSRNNVLHLWPFLMDDLRSLGAKKFYGKFCAGAIDHVSIRVVQCILLKVCLILGVKVHFPVTFHDLVEPRSDSDGWHVSVHPSTSPVASYSYDAIIAADGKQYSLPGFKSKEFRAKLAIAITVNFVNSNTQQEAAVEEISGVAFIYNQSFFKSLAQKHGIELENIVYYKDETHYFVMTAKKSSLLSKGVIKKDYNNPDMLLSRSNVSQLALEAYAREAVTFSTKGGLGDLKFAPNHRGENDVAIFDFTSLFASENASRIIERKGQRILLGIAGDSLLEPFWPTGSGLARGFLGCYDAAWMLKRYSEGVSPLEIIEERESLFRLLPSTTPERLQKKTSSYTISPQTRYVNLNSFTSSTDVSHLYDSDTRPKPVERKLKEEITVPKVKRFHSMETQSPRRTAHTIPTLESIRASISPAASPEPAELIEKSAEHATPSKRASKEFSLFKFAKLLFGGRKTENEKLNVKEKTPERKKSKTPDRKKSKTPDRQKSKTPERRKSRERKVKSKERESSKEKLPKKKEEKMSKNEQKDKSEESGNKSTVPLSREKQNTPPSHRNANTVHNLTQFYETSGESHTQKTPAMSTSSVVTKGSVLSAIQKLEEKQKRGNYDMIDYEESEDISNEYTDSTVVIDSTVMDTTGSTTTDTTGTAVMDTTCSTTAAVMDTTGSTAANTTGTAVMDTTGNTTGTAVMDTTGSTTANTTGTAVMDITGSTTANTTGTAVMDTTGSTTANTAGSTVIDAVSAVQERVCEFSEDTKVDEEVKSKATETGETNAKGRSYTMPGREEVPLRDNSTTATLNLIFSKGRRHFKSKDDSAIQLEKTNSGIHAPLWLRNYSNSLTKCLETLRSENPNLYATKTTLEVLNFIFGNIINDPTEDTYRRIRATSDHFHHHVYQYSGAQQFMWMCGWMEVDEYLVLPMNQSLDIPKKVLDRQIETIELKLQSEHINHIFSEKTVSSVVQGTSKDSYTDSIVLSALNKAQRDHSIMLASVLKEEMSKREKIRESEHVEEIDKGTISKEEETLIISSASQARAWWEGQQLQRHPSTYSLYFQPDEMEEIKSLATEGVPTKGVVSERVRAFETTHKENSDSEDSDSGTEDSGTEDDNGSNDSSSSLSKEQTEEHPESNEGNINEVVSTNMENQQDKVTVEQPILLLQDNKDSKETDFIWQKASRASEVLLEQKRQI